MAAEYGLTTLEANRLAEQVPELDDLIDDTITDLGRRADPMIFDSRIAWHLIPSAYKVHLIVDPAVGAARIYRDRASRTESYRSAAEAEYAAEERHSSERRRFIGRNGVDISQLRNYDLVVDTTFASPCAIVAEIFAALTNRSHVPATIRISPRRIKPAPKPLKGASYAGDAAYPVVGYLRPDIFLLHIATTPPPMSSADRLMPAVLGAEGDELRDAHWRPAFVRIDDGWARGGDEETASPRGTGALRA